MAYAFVDDIAYRQWGTLYVGGKLLEHVPRLAICINLGGDRPSLFHCDETWRVLGSSGADTIDAIKAQAENNYPGVASRWIDINTSVVEALSYYDKSSGGIVCSFCGKRPFEITRWVEGNGARICNLCVEECRRIFQDQDSGVVPNG